MTTVTVPSGIAELKRFLGGHYDYGYIVPWSMFHACLRRVYEHDVGDALGASVLFGYCILANLGMLQRRGAAIRDWSITAKGRAALAFLDRWRDDWDFRSDVSFQDAGGVNVGRGAFD